jgi:hypothetical protein
VDVGDAPRGQLSNEPLWRPSTFPSRSARRRGSAASAESVPRRPEYTDAKTLPTIATPRVPPSSRVVSLTAEKQPLGSALNHLQLVGETLSDRGEPHPFAEATLIRTAITAASYSLWTLHDDATERRNRALQFNFKDLDGWGGYYRTDRQDPAATEDDRAKANDVIVDARRRKEWIVELPNLRIGASQMFRDVERCPRQAVRVAAQETRSDQNADAGRFLDDVIVSRQALFELPVHRTDDASLRTRQSVFNAAVSSLPGKAPRLRALQKPSRPPDASTLR